MAKETNKNVTIGIIIAACVAVIVATVAIVLINSNQTASENNDNSSTSEPYVTSQELLKTTPSVEIAFGDFDGMQTLSKEVQNGKRTGEIVSIDGLVSHPGNAYSVVQQSSDGTTKIGTAFIMDDSGNYPEDGTRITIVGKIVEVSPMNFQIVTLKDFVKER